MADANDAFSTLDDFLLSLADGIAQAQDSLARSGTAGPPGRHFTYHLPRVDFELKMNLRVVEDEALSARYAAIRPERASSKHLLFKPLSSQEAASTLEIAAVIKGAFVAVPANDGLPGALLETRLQPTSDPRVLMLRVVARNTAGEPLSGIDVQVNLDREESAELTALSGRTLTLAPQTGFTRGVVTTDAAGVAEAELRIDAAQTPGILALVIDAADRTEKLVYEVRA
jgi:hypothetical protein